MKNIILNSVQLASSLKLDASYFSHLPPQYKGGFRGFFMKNGLILLVFGLFLGFMSCDDKTKTNESNIAPSIESKNSATEQTTEPEQKVVAATTGRKIVQLNTAKFTIKDGKPGQEKIIEAVLKDGIPKLQTLYAYAGPKSDVNKILEKTRPFLTQDAMDKEQD